jgi:hypothetical protein
MANLNTPFLVVLVVLLALLSITNGLESRNNPPQYKGQGFFAIIFAMGALSLVFYKMRGPP